MNKRFSICLLNDSFPPVIDGVANTVLNYARIISRDYGKVIVAVPRYPGEADNYPFPVIRYPSIKTPKTAGYRMGIPVPGVVREISKHRVSIIHSHCPFVSTVISKSLRQATGAPLIMTYHTKFDIDIANSWNSELIRAAAKKIIVSNAEACDEVWAVSRGAGENLKSMGYQGDYRIMENGVDFSKGRAAERAIGMISAEYGLHGDMPVYLFVGRMMWYKGIGLILAGLAKAKKAGIRFKMLFVGGGGDYSEIVRRTGSLGLMEDCIFAGPVRDRKKLRACFSRADMFLFPSTFDTSGIVVREAAACGLASVLIRGSAAAEPVTDGVDGILIDENPDSLAWAVINLSLNREHMRELGRRAMERLHFTWEEAIAKANERYHELREEHIRQKRATGSRE